MLRRILKEPFGLERLSIICSLPYVLLMWGYVGRFEYNVLALTRRDRLVAFLGAFGIIFYDGTATHVRIPVTIALFLLVLCLFFCLYTAGPPEKEDQKPPRRSRRDRDTVTSLSKV